MARITTLHTRFVDLGVRGYIGVTRVGVPGHGRPFSDTWWRYFDEIDNRDIGPLFPTKAECLSYLPTYAERNGYAYRNEEAYMRAGIIGQITGYAEGQESHGQGIEEDAASISREYPGQTIRFAPERGDDVWYERGVQIATPEWAFGVECGHRNRRHV